MSNKKSLDVPGIIERAKQAIGITTDTELANLLGIKQNTVSSWRKRKNIDLLSIIAICQDVSADWLLYGIGSPELGTDTDRTARLINLMLRDMDEDRKRDLLKKIQIDQLLEKLLKERKAA
jgi:transcriptional regulator with XRE-family HTH domain